MSVFTPANQLTLTRVMLVPPFVILTVYGYFGWALIVFAVAGLTDLLDGLIARKFSRRTDLGAWLDPMADKLLIVATVIVLTLPGLGLVNTLPIWLTILVISRDVLIVGTRRRHQSRHWPAGIPTVHLGQDRDRDLHHDVRHDHVFQLSTHDVADCHAGHLRVGRDYAGFGLSLRLQHHENN